MSFHPPKLKDPITYDDNETYRDAFEFQESSLEQTVLFGFRHLNHPTYDDTTTGNSKKLHPLPILLSDVPLALANHLNDSNDDDGHDDALLDEPDNDNEHDYASSNDQISLEHTKSSLSFGQHARYLKLLQELCHNTNSYSALNNLSYKRKRQEFQALRELVNHEREQYKVALQNFRIKNKNTFLEIGFGSDRSTPSACFAETASKYNSAYVARWCSEGCKNALRYGNCFQEISLGTYSVTTSDFEIFFPSDVQNKFEQGMIDFDRFNNGRLLLPSIQRFPVLKVEKESIRKLKGQKLIGLKSDTTAIETVLLRNDDRAINIALEQEVSVIITENALLSLLQRPGDILSRWKIPFKTLDAQSTTPKSQKRHRMRQLIMVDDPIPVALYPRECLSVGLKESIQSMLFEDNGSRNNFVYNTITLNTSEENLSAIKVLVRSPAYVCGHDLIPVFCHIQLEYFPEHREIASCCERSNWMLNKVLFPESTSYLFHVDPNMCSIIDVEEISMAHILASTNNIFNPNLHFGAAASFLKSLESSSLPNNEYIACCVADKSVISIHKSVGSNEENVEVDLVKEFDNANYVFTSETALMACFRMWEWNPTNEGVIPYTFPLHAKSTPIFEQ